MSLQPEGQYAIMLKVGECSDGFCVIMIIAEEGKQPQSLQGAARYPTPQAARDDGAVLLSHLIRVIGRGPISVESSPAGEAKIN